MSKNHFENIIRDKFNEEENFPFEQNAWKEMESLLEQKRKRRIPWIPILLSAGLGGALIWNVSLHHKINTQEKTIERFQKTEVSNFSTNTQIDTVYIYVKENNKNGDLSAPTLPSNISPLKETSPIIPNIKETRTEIKQPKNELQESHTLSQPAAPSISIVEEGKQVEEKPTIRIPNPLVKEKEENTKSKEDIRKYHEILEQEYQEEKALEEEWEEEIEWEDEGFED